MGAVPVVETRSGRVVWSPSIWVCPITPNPFEDTSFCVVFWFRYEDWFRGLEGKEIVFCMVLSRLDESNNEEIEDDEDWSFCGNGCKR